MPLAPGWRWSLVGLPVPIDVDPTRGSIAHYAHMAIQPYPAELEADIRLADGSCFRVRPIRPEVAELERAFVASLSDNTR